MVGCAPFFLKTFHYIIGINCSLLLQKCSMDGFSNLLLETYFLDKSIKRSELKKFLKERQWDDDEDAIKFAEVFMLECFLFSKKANKVVSDFVCLLTQQKAFQHKFLSKFDSIFVIIQLLLFQKFLQLVPFN